MPERIPVKAAHKRLALVACFGLIFIEYQAGTLFIWPLDHSCAKPANLTIFTELFTDSKSQPIDLDAVQRNLFDATPEDAFTMARAASMGIHYDDVARCFEYPVDYQDDNQPVFNMDNLEPCRFGLRFELLSSRISIIDHYNLACRRQWLKMLVPQGFALGLLSGLLLTYFVCFGPARHESPLGTRRPTASPCRTDHNTSAFMVLYFVALILDQVCIGNNNHNNPPRRAPPVGDSAASELAQRERTYFLFVASIFLRSALMGSVLCRIMIRWRPIRMVADVNNKMVPSDFHRMCFISFAMALVVLKLSFIPAALKLFASWRSLSLFLTASQLLLSVVVSAFEALQARCGFLPIHENDPQVRPACLSTQFGVDRRGQGESNEPKQFAAANVVPPEGGQPTYNLEIERDRCGLFDMELMTNSTTNARAGRWQPAAHVLSRVEPSFKACEFCSVTDDRIFGIMSQLRVEGMSPEPPDASMQMVEMNKTNRNDLSMKANATDSSSSSSNNNNNLGAYLPTTMPLDRLAHVAGDPIKVRVGLTIGGHLHADGKMHSPPDPSSYNNRSSSRTSRGQASCQLPIISSDFVRHNSSLFELNVTRWPIASRLTILTLCLTFNYFLLQTIPNHKLQHGESISSLMDRKSSHRSAESSNAHQQNNSAELVATRPGRGGELQADAMGGQPDKLEPVESVYSERLISRERHRTSSTASPSRRLVAANRSEASKTSSKITQQPEGSPTGAETRDVGELSDKIDPHHSGSVSISAIAQVGPEYAIGNCRECANEDLDMKQPLNGTKMAISKNKTMEVVRPLGGNGLASNRTGANSTTTSNSSISFHKIDLAPRDSLAETNRVKYKYDIVPAGNGTNNSLLVLRAGESNLEDLFKINISHMFNYDSVDYASQTFDRLSRSWNPLELAWIMMKLNGWPLELSIILLHSTKLTNFEPTYFKLNRLFSLPVLGSKLMAVEWLLVALLPKQNHLIEPDWLLSLLLLLGRFVSSLMLFHHLHMILKLGSRLGSRRLLSKTVGTIPVTLCALALALWAPILERASLAVTPLLLVASSLAIYYLSRGIEARFKDLLCPMMFE